MFWAEVGESASPGGAAVRGRVYRDGVMVINEWIDGIPWGRAGPEAAQATIAPGGTLTYDIVGIAGTEVFDRAYDPTECAP